MKKPQSSQASAPSQVSAQDLWLAGLDAFSQATRAATQAATHAATQAASQVTNMAASAAAPPSLEGLFEARVAKALARLGTPTRAELDALTAQVAHLQASLKSALQAAASTKGKPVKAVPVKKNARTAAPAKQGKVSAKRPSRQS